MSHPTPTPPISEQSLAWLRHAAALGRAEPQALLHLLERVEALEAAAALPQPDKLDRLIEMDRAEDEAGAALPEPPELDVPQALAHEWINRHATFCAISTRGARERTGTDWGRVITDAALWGQQQGWDAAMAAVQAQQQQPAAEGTPPPAPSAPATLVQRLAFLIAEFASTSRIGDDANPTAIAVVRLVAAWLRLAGSAHAAPYLSTEADRAAAELEGQATPPELDPNTPDPFDVPRQPAAPPAAPAGGLVWRVARAADCYPYENARAAIREVAAWLEQHRGAVSNGGLWAGLLRYEAKQEARDNG